MKKEYRNVFTEMGYTKEEVENFKLEGQDVIR